MSDKQKFIKALIMPTLFGILILNVQLIQSFTGIDLTRFGIFPHKATGIIGILLSPLIHSGFNHLISNIIPLFLMGTALYYFYPSSANKVITIIYILTGILVWLFARPAYHIGASGVVYGLASFLFFSGIIKRDVRSITVALLVVFLYGGLVWGILPIDNKISYESHFYGGVVGFICAFIFRKSDPYKKYDWEDEEKDWDDNDLKIKYD
ncbi:MAG: rhomboid family intramembrane serine protease [Ignavibacteria bacterium]|nr:MAG: rhomboid family intramembrane serine protease [Ignavibacteria bacterium]